MYINKDILDTLKPGDKVRMDYEDYNKYTLNYSVYFIVESIKIDDEHYYINFDKNLKIGIKRPAEEKLYFPDYLYIIDEGDREVYAIKRVLKGTKLLYRCY